jgi:hypothetical protein
LPLWACAWRLSPSQLTITKQTFEELERLCMPFLFLLTGVAPTAIFLFACHHLPNKYPLHISKIFPCHLHGAAVFFSKNYMEKGYHQAQMAKDDIPIIVPFGLIEFLHMPFGLKLLPKSFNSSWTPSFLAFSFLLLLPP